MVNKNDFFQIKKEGSQSGFYGSTDAPYVIGKLVKIKDPDAAKDFKVKQVGYHIIQVPGMKIFFVHAGFHKISKANNSDQNIINAITNLCDWYLTFIAKGNKSLHKNFNL